MEKNLLSARGVTKRFGGSEVLHGVDIDLCAGDFTVIMGSSGSGKSTLLYALSGMDQVTSGSILFDGQNITAYSEKQMTKLRASAFGFVFQKTHLIANLTVMENIVMAGLISGKETEDAIRQHAAALIKQMNLSGTENRLPSQVSGGEGQRAAVARAVISRPRILFADEPTGALNKANTVEVLNLLSALHDQGQTILLVTHDREAALRGNRVLYLEDGRVTGELALSPYHGQDAEREKQLTDWLIAQGW